MYWIVIITVTVLVWIAIGRLSQEEDRAPAVTVFGVLGSLMVEGDVLAIGVDLPQVYQVEAGAEPAYRKVFAAVPFVKYSYGGIEFRPLPSTTYVINPAGRALTTAEVSYTDDEDLVGREHPVRRDTLRDRLLEFPTASVYVFKDAPKVMEVYTPLTIGTRDVTVVALPGQDLDALHEARFRPIRMSDQALVDYGCY